MKKLNLLVLFLICFAFVGFTQTIPPPYINYQAVLYDVNGPNPNSVLANQSFPTYVNIQDELGNLLYKEEHYASTDANGQVTVKIGDGVYLQGPITNFNQINWGSGKYYLIVDFDINGTISSTAPEQLVTVPYSFYAGKAGNGLTSVSDNGDGSLTFTYANGTTYITPILTSLQGGGSGGGINIIDNLNSTNDLPSTGNAGDGYIINGDLFVWNQTTNSWDNVGNIQGPAGANGANGQNALIKTTTEPAGANCATGGVKLESGLDANANGTLDAGEINPALTRYVCNGIVGATGTTGPQGSAGATGPQGTTGIQGSAGTNGTNGQNSLVKTTTETAGVNCASGGVKLEYGLDVSANGILDASEINATLTKYICNGATGAAGLQGIAGATGAAGPQGIAGVQGATGAAGETGPQGSIGLTGSQGVAGTNGQNSLVKTTTESAGSNCTTGGVKLEYGLDANTNGTLDAGEINATLTKYICNGATGATGLQGIAGATGAAGPQGIAGVQGATGAAGATGPQGSIGLTGSQGVAGTNGQNSLVKTTTESAGVNCASGGVKLEYGLDVSANGILDAGEINATLTKYICNGAQGATGAQGVQGTIGATGPQGTTGIQGSAGTNGTNGQNSLVKTTTESAGANCASGGVKLEYGLDVSSNGILDAGEINAALTKYICNGATGAQGAQGTIGATGPQGTTGIQGPAGTNGTNGTNGQNSLVKTTTETAGVNCASGGVKLEYGLDANANGVLDVGEINATLTKYICNGATGATGLQGIAGATGAAGPQGIAGVQGATGAAGATGPQGSIGLTGSQGAAGTNGQNSLVKTTTETAGVNCASGGVKLEYGLDVSANGILDAGEINATLTKYICNGATGATGLQGIAGATGAAGPQGIAGVQGATGAAGATGPQGSIGLTGSQGVAGTNGQNSLVKTTTESAGANCASGGVKLEYGLDANVNGALDAGEINATLTKYICNGAQGVQGTIGATGPQGTTGIQGSAGTNGTNGQNSLVKTTTESAGANCASGGVKLEYGLDVSANGILDAGEINATLTKYICNGAQGATGAQGVQGTIGATGPQGIAGVQGATGAAGATGPQGSIGLTGSQGVAGTNGQNSLVKTTTETAGVNCASGGVKLEYGLDVSANGILEAGEINAALTKYICNGATGAQGVTGAQGTIGATGPQGTTGAVGPQGIAGPTWNISTNNFNVDGAQAIVSNNSSLQPTVTSTSKAWLVGGNSASGDVTIGTTTANNFDIITGNIVRGRFSSLGEFYIGGTTTVENGDLMNGLANATFPWAINGYTSFNGGGVYGTVKAGTSIFAGVQGESMSTGTIAAGVRGSHRTSGVSGTSFGNSTTSPTIVSGVHGSIYGYTGNYKFGVWGSGGTSPGSGAIFGDNYGINGAIGYYTLGGADYSFYGFGNAYQNGIVAGIAPNGNNNGKTSGSTLKSSLKSTSLSANNHVGIGIYGGFMGGWVRGLKYGFNVKGETYSMYVDGKSYTNEPLAYLMPTSTNERVAGYMSASMNSEVTDKGKTMLKSGKIFVPFNSDFKKVMSKNTDDLIITATPQGKTNGIYISEITSEGFWIYENNNGASSVAVSWMMSSPVKNADTQVASELLNKEFDLNMDKFMFNENDLQSEKKSLWWDGTQMRWDAPNPTLFKQTNHERKNQLLRKQD